MRARDPWLRRGTGALLCAALLGGLAAAALHAGRASASDDRLPVPIGGPHGGSEVEDCRGCHADAHPGFARSGHALAGVEPWYVRSIALSPPALVGLCAKCHAPEGNKDGVTCATCHLAADGAVLVARPGFLVAPHATRVSPGLTSGRLCATCHTVDLPLGKDGAILRLQDTPAEHAAWRAKTGDTRRCVDCHVGANGPHFAGMRDRATLEGAICVAMRAAPLTSSAGEVTGEIRLENRAGHCFPAGSRLREVRVRATIVAPDGRRIDVAARRLGLSGDPAAGEDVIDTRLQPGETRAVAIAATLPAGFPRTGLALECAIDLAPVSLDFPDTHPMIPPEEPRTVPVFRQRIAIPEAP